MHFSTVDIIIIRIIFVLLNKYKKTRHCIWYILHHKSSDSSKFSTEILIILLLTLSMLVIALPCIDFTIFTIITYRKICMWILF